MILEILGFAHPFLDGKSIGMLCCVAKELREFCLKIPLYVDMTQMNEVQTLKAHDQTITSIGLLCCSMYTTGVNDIKMWKHIPDVKDTDYNNCFQNIEGSILTPNKSTVTSMVYHQNLISSDCIYLGLDNGSIKVISSSSRNNKWNCIKEIQYHTKCVNDMILSSPTDTQCSLHGVLNHRCLLYSASDDRNIFLFDTISHEKVDCIIPPCINGATPQCLSLSYRHLFVGNSRGKIYVYPINNVCEREDGHMCKTDGGNTHIPYCVQEEIKHGEDIPIAFLKTGGKYHEITHLFSASYDGSVAVFKLESEGISFPLVYMIKKHKRAVKCLELTWSHLYTCSDDGYIHIFELGTLEWQRSIDCNQIVVNGNRNTISNDIFVKFVFVHDKWEDCRECKKVYHDMQQNRITKKFPIRYLYAGLSSGQIHRWPLGHWM